MNFYKRFIGDYARDTAHLSLVEHGAYTVLLDTCYATEKPLPADLIALYRICRASTTMERKAVQRVADEFFPVNGDGTRKNNRAQKELANASAYAEAQAMRAHKRWHKPEGMPTQSPGDASHSHSHRKPRSKALSASADGAFVRFYEAYPRKTKRSDAARAFKRLNPDGALLDVMLAALEAHKATEQWKRGVIPHPATWLNAKRWEDELAPLSSLGECMWNANGNREEGKPKCTQAGALEKQGIVYCKAHGARA